MLHALIGAALPARAAVDSPLVPWGRSDNGATSVIDTVSATAIAIDGGFTATFAVGTIAYLIAGVLGARVARRLALAGGGSGAVT